MSEQGASVSDVRIPTLDRIATRGLVWARSRGTTWLVGWRRSARAWKPPEGRQAAAGQCDD